MIFEVENTIIEVENTIIEVENTIIEVQNTIFEVDFFSSKSRGNEKIIFERIRKLSG